jgi:hypothetical protein
MTNEPRGCLAFLFGFGGGYASEYRAEQEYFDEGEEH